MPEINLDDDSDDKVMDFTSVPSGNYLCRVAEVRTGTTRAGDPRWSVRLEVITGHYTGRMAAWDALVFSTRGRARVRAIFKAIGLPHTGKVHVEPDDMVGRTAQVEIRPAEYVSPTGEVVKRNEVPYDGWRSPPCCD